MTTRGLWFTIAGFVLLGMTTGLIGYANDALTSPERSAEGLARDSAVKEKLLRPQTASDSTLNNPTGGVPIQSRPATLKPRWVVSKPVKTRFHKGVSRDQIVVKFKDGIAVRLNPTTSSSKPDPMLMLSLMTPDRRARMQRQKLSDDVVQTDLIRIKALLNQPSVRRVKPLFSRPDTTLQAERQEAESKTGQEHADLGNYFLVRLKAGTQGGRLVDELNAVSSVELAYLAPIPVLTQGGRAIPQLDLLPKFIIRHHLCLDNVSSGYGGIGLLSNCFEEKQGYRRRAPEGIDAIYAGKNQGGDGTGTFFVDIEEGWNTEHEDLPKPDFTSGVFSTDDWNIQHGTAVLGEIVALPNSYGVTGIAHGAKYGLSSSLSKDDSDPNEEPEFNAALAIIRAFDRLRAGNVILIEIGQKVELETPIPHYAEFCTSNTCGFCHVVEGHADLFVPLEFYSAEFDAIQLATSRGIHVVEPAANGGLFLDFASFEGRFDRNNRDSGAIMVGGSNTRLVPSCLTNRGSRLDVHSWGEKVWTTGGLSRYFEGNWLNTDDPNRWYMENFNGTSSAAAIVAGAVLSIEGVRRAAGRFSLPTRAMRTLLRETGTPQQGSLFGPSGPQMDLIGPQPDLRRAIPRALSE